MTINGDTRLLGILGNPVSHSLSPRMQNAAFAAMDLNICYVPLPVEPPRLEAAVNGIRAMQFLGVNVTIPHKVHVARLVDQLDASASRVGAVNTIVNRDGALFGYNTDGDGFIRALAEVAPVDFPGAAAVILGAGGASRAVAAALAANGCPRITIINRTLANAEAIRDLIQREFPATAVDVLGWNDDPDEAIAASKLLINATSVGMSGDLKMLPVRVDKISEGHIVCDLIYTRSQETPLLVAAREKGATLMGGIGMLLHQGAASIQLWTGKEPPLDVMRKALESQ